VASLCVPFFASLAQMEEGGEGGLGFALLPASLQMPGHKAKRPAPLGIRQGCKVAAKKAKLESEAAASKAQSQLAVWMVLHKGSLFKGMSCIV
jgi:hypothetical protein